jgi:methionyl aminopeptidase
MTEKQYGGATGRKASSILKSNQPNQDLALKKSPNELEILSENLTEEKIKNYKKAGEIAKQVKEYAKQIAKPKTPLLELAEKVEAKIHELGGVPAFPVNLSINEIAAHYTPSHDDKTLASGLLKIDLGVHVNGCIADTAISFDLEDSEENKKLINASEKALNIAIDHVKNSKENSKLNEIGSKIKIQIESLGFYPIINLSGHSLDDYQIHAGLTIPNCDNNNSQELKEGAFAIEPFATTGLGQVYEGKPSGIYNLQKFSNTRDTFTRKVIQFINENYKTLPFASRWLVKEFGSRALTSLALLKQQGLLHEYPQLVEKSHKKVSQAENSFIIYNGKVEVLT